MNRIDERFAKVKADGRKALITFLTVGDPNMEVSEKAIYTMQEEGVDLIELGVPFSDPAADGPVIQRADERALAQGVDIFKVFELVRKIRNNVEVPMVFLLYYNVMVQYGIEKFFKRCQETGVDGLIIPDLPYEEKNELLSNCRKYDVDLISLIAPTSDDRIQMIAREGMGYIYVVSSLGVTGIRSNITTDIGAIVKRIREVTDNPVAVGFGIATPEQAEKMAGLSDGAIVGSAIVKIVEQYGKDAAGPVKKYVEEMVAAVRKA